jgi:hypothetical protein
MGWGCYGSTYASIVRGIPDSEKRRRGAEMIYELETEFRKAGWPEDFVYDEEQDVYRFREGSSPSPGSTQTSGV